MIHLTRLTGVVFVAVLHFAIDADKPGENVAAFWWQMATGSMLPAGSSLSRGMAGKR